MIKLYTVNTRKIYSMSMALLIAVCAFFISSIPQTAQAQVITENFEAPNTSGAGLQIPNLPLGWSWGKISGTAPSGNDFITTSLATNAPNNPVNPMPTTPPSTPHFLMYRGYPANAGDDAYIVSPAFDFRAGPGAFSYSFFHSSTGANPAADYVEVYFNSVPVFGGATLIAGSLVTRNGGTGWSTKTVNIPQRVNCETYILIRAVSGTNNGGGNMYFDNFSITTSPQAQIYESYALTQNANPTGINSTNQDIHRMMFVTCGAGSPISVTGFQFNTNGTTNLADISNPRVWFTKGNPSFTSNDPANILFASAPVGTNLVFTANQPLENDTNYFWLTYNINPFATAGNYVDADWLDFTLSGTTGMVTVNQAPAGARLIAQNYCTPTYGLGTTWPGDFIQDVQTFNGLLGNIVNVNSGYHLNPPYYTFYPPGPNRTTTLEQGQTYQLRTKVGTYCCRNNIVAWIDYDGNGIFSPEERIYEAYHSNGDWLSGNQSATGSFTIPTLGGGSNPSFWGPRRMRVREIYNNRSNTAPTTPSNTYNNSPSTNYSGHLSPCNSYTWGETEDYIVTIRPDCQPGEWLGFTEDWSDPTNWCDGLPTPTTNVLIPYGTGLPKGGKFPHLLDGTLATTNNLEIQPGASITIESPKNGNLQINGTLTNNGTITVATNFDNNFILGSGTNSSLTGTFTSPFEGTKNDQRTQMRYFASELLTKGFTAGDAISTVGLQTADAGALNAFNPGQQFINFNVTVGHTTNTNNWVFAPPNNTSQNWFSFSGTTSTYSIASIQPPLNSTVTFPLSSDFIWNGINDILVEMCYDNPNSSFARTNGVNVNFTQTTGVPSFKATHFAGSSAINGCVIGTPANGTTGYTGNVLDRRANLIVAAYSPNSVYPIYVRGDWINNGTFVAGRSNVVFDGTAALQTISGTNLTSFSRMSVQKSGVVRLARTVEIDSSLYLGSGALELNSFTLTLKNPAINPSPPTVTSLANLYALPVVPAWARNTGYIRAETMPSTGVGYIQWNIGNVATVPSSYQFPFGSGVPGSAASTGSYIPVDIDYTTANTNLGNMRVSTYATPPNNLEMPTGVGHINGSVASPNDANMINRYWIMEKPGAATSGAGFKISWAAGEVAANNPAPYRAQRWWGTGWPHPGIGDNTPANTIVVTAAQLDGYTVSGAPGGWFAVNNWAAAGLATPLPIELLSFDAQLKGQEVHLKWTTASEKDNDFFTIEKTRDAYEFDFVARVQSQYNNSTFAVDYHTIDPEPFRGLSYYRLGQTDFDGTTTYSKLVPVTFNFNKFEIVYTANNDNNIIVAFGYDYDEPVRFQVTDALGRVHLKEDFPEVETGGNMLTIDGSTLADGIYFITIYNTKESVSRKIFFSKQ